VLGSVEQSFLTAAFEVIAEEYGDLETYFNDGLNLGARERLQLKARYLEA
jgi:protein-tyrosine phosphatase